MYIAPLFALHGTILGLTIHQLWVSRNLQTEFQESEQVFKALTSILLVCFVGLPSLYLGQASGNAKLFILSAIIFIICTSLLGLIFVPKIRYQRKKKIMSIKLGNKWQGATAVADIAEAANYINNNNNNNSDSNNNDRRVDSRSMVNDVVILSTKTRQELIIDNNKLQTDNQKLRERIHAYLEKKKKVSFRSEEKSEEQEPVPVPVSVGGGGVQFAAALPCMTQNMNESINPERAEISS